MDSASLERFIGRDVGPFGELLSQLSNPHPSDRLQAENTFNALRGQFSEGLVVKLVSYVKSGQTPPVRSFAATLLRQVLTKDRPSLWTSISQPVQEAIRGELTSILSSETEENVRKQVADVVSELYAKIMGSECWPELLPFLCQQILHQDQSDRATLVEISIYILAEIAPVLTDSLENPTEQFITMMKPCLRNQNPSIRLMSMKAVKCFAITLENMSHGSQLKGLMDDVLNAFAAIRFHTTGATEAYAIMIELAEYVPVLFEGVEEQVIREFLSRAKDPAGDIESLTMTLEFLLALIQGIPGVRFEQLRDCIGELVALIMNCLIQIEDVADWHQKCGGDGTSADFGDLHDLAIESVDRIASSIPAEIFLSIFSVYAQQWGPDPDWKKRHAVLSVLGQMAEGCSSEIANAIDTLLGICMQGLSDGHVRVRWAACQATGLVADEIGSLITSSQRDQLITKLIHASVIDDPGALSVQRHALHCFINITDTTEHTFKETTLDEIVKWILQSMQFSRESVNQTAMDVLTCITLASEPPSFAKYYNDCMKAVFDCLNRITDPDDLIEMSSIVNVMTQVGAAAGKECFVHEYRFIVDYLKGLADKIGTLREEEDKMAVSINVLNSVARVCLIVGADFDSLEMFKELLLKALTTEPKLETISAEQMDEEDEEDEADAYTTEMGGKFFRIEKMSLGFCKCGIKTAMSMARDLKHVFFPVLVPVFEAFLPTMEYKLIKEIRHLAIQAQPLFLKCAAERHKLEQSDALRDFLLTLLTKQWESFLEKLNEMENEMKETSAHEVLEAVAHIIEVMHGQIEPSMMMALFEKLQQTMRHFANLRKERSSVEEGELNEDEMDEFWEEVSREHEYLISIQKLISAILVHTQDQYFGQISPLISVVYELISHLTNDRRDWPLLETILTLFTDMCEYSEIGGQTYAASVCEMFLGYLDHPYPPIRHTTAFGIGVLAQRTATIFQSSAVSAAQKLMKVLDAAAAPSVDEAVDASEVGMAENNAVSALSKILMTHGHLFSEEDRRMARQLWLAHLPLKYDHVEAQFVHSYIIQAIQNQDSEILGRNWENLMKVVEILMEVIASGDPLATPEDMARIPSLLKSLENENGLSQMATQKMQKWSENEKAHFTRAMNASQQQSAKNMNN